MSSGDKTEDLQNWMRLSIGPIGVMSDAHGNVKAFEKALRLLQDASATSYIFLGDALGYMGGVAVLDHLMDLGDSVLCVKGNHEAMALGEINYSRCKEDVYRLQPVVSALTTRQRDFIESWPASRDLQWMGKTIWAQHGSPSDPLQGYVYPDTQLESMGENPPGILLCGNTHRPFVRRIGPTIVANAGSVGMPRDDGRYGSAVLLMPDSVEVEILRFDISDTYDSTDKSGGAPHPTVVALRSRESTEIYGRQVP